MTTYMTTESQVYHMEMDQYTQGNIVFSDESALKTTNGDFTKNIVGQSTKEGYREGVGEAARFRRITGFYQTTSRTVVIADFYNHCLRLADRFTGQTQAFSGTCTKSGYADGSQALFYYPWSVIPDIKNQDKLIVGLRHVDVKTGIVSTFYKDAALYSIYGMTQELSSGDLFMTTRSAIYKLHYQSKQLLLIAGSKSHYGYRDGELSVSQFHYPEELLLIDDRRKLLIADEYTHRLRVLDMVSNITHSLCTGTRRDTDGDLNSCSLHHPHSLMVAGDSLFVGGYRKIRKISGM